MPATVVAEVRYLLGREAGGKVESLFSNSLAAGDFASVDLTVAAVRNANPEDALEPFWLRGLAELAKAVSDAAGMEADWSHVERDWDARQARWQQVADSLRSNEDLERALDEHPGIWRRASRADSE